MYLIVAVFEGDYVSTFTFRPRRQERGSDRSETVRYKSMSTMCACSY